LQSLETINSKLQDEDVQLKSALFSVPRG